MEKQKFVFQFDGNHDVTLRSGLCINFLPDVVIEAESVKEACEIMKKTNYNAYDYSHINGQPLWNDGNGLSYEESCEMYYGKKQ